jgi:hypothetical protein
MSGLSVTVVYSDAAPLGELIGLPRLPDPAGRLAASWPEARGLGTPGRQGTLARPARRDGR